MNSSGIASCILTIVIFFLGCNTNDNGRAVKNPSENGNKEISESTVIPKFELLCPADLMVDSNSLIFYCARTFDTSSLIHIRKGPSGIKGVYYETLPTFHRNINDFADSKNDLLFFEGYSFVIDSALWEAIKDRAQEMLDMKDRLTKKDKYVDDSKYALFHNSQSMYGDGNYENLYDSFNRFLKDNFVSRFQFARKPKIKKSK